MKSCMKSGLKRNHVFLAARGDELLLTLRVTFRHDALRSQLPSQTSPFISSVKGMPGDGFGKCR